MDGSCQVPIGGYATNKENGEIEFTGLIMTQTVQRDMSTQKLVKILLI